MTRLFGGLLLATGILVMTCSGLCSLFVVIGGFGMVFQEPTVILLPLIIGGVPFAVGFGLYRWGRSLLRRTDVGPDDRVDRGQPEPPSEP